jgi:uncharacterized iron-regulated membrane protein
MHFRKVLFWLHLVAGLVSGISIAIMCFTGTVLSFEKQLIAWAERDVRHVAVSSPNEPRRSLDELAQRVREAEPKSRTAALTVSADPHQAVIFSFGREDNVFVNPYTGEVRRPASTTLQDFMGVMTGWHRYLSLSGDHRAAGKLVNGICNLAFLVLAITGLYLWIPRKRAWSSVRAVALFNSRVSGKARDFNWHNVIGLWSAPILIVLTLTALPISFRWGTALVYRIVGEEPPALQGAGAASSPSIILPATPFGVKPLTRDAQFKVIQIAFPHWEQITLRLSAAGRGASQAGGQLSPARAQGPQPLNFTIKSRDAWPRTAATTITLNPFTGEVMRREAFSDQSRGRRLRSWTRFLHTGEALGWTGQLVAGLASLGGCFLVYTGIALAIRRFFGRRAPGGARTHSSASEGSIAARSPVHEP